MKYNIRYALLMIACLLSGLVILSQESKNSQRIHYYQEKIEVCEFDEIPQLADSIFLFVKELKKNKSNSLKEIETLEATAFNDLGLYYHENNLTDKALEHYLKALKLHEKWNTKSGIASVHNNIGMIYKDRGDVKKAAEYILKGIRYNEELKNFQEVAVGYSNIGNIYFVQSEIELAQTYFKKALDFGYKFNLKPEIAYGLNNMATTYVEQKKYSEALNYFEKSLEIRKTLKDVALAPTYNNIAFMHRRLGNYDKALEFYHLAIDTRKTDRNAGLAASYLGIGNVLHETNKNKEALKYAEKAYAIYKELNLLENIGNTSLLLHRLYASKQDYKNAYLFLGKFITNRDSIVNAENKKSVYKQQIQLEYEKKSFADSLKTEEDKKVVSIQLKQEKTQRLALYGGLFLVGLFGLFVFNRLKVTQKQKNIIELKERETKQQKHIVEEKNKEIIESITYAKRLQEAILPPQDFINENLPHNFVLYKPKDLVAGDFYWAEERNDLFFIAAADSTGHGVPGAMVSVVCSNALNRTVKEFNIVETGKILDKTRELVLETFEKSISEVKDGMDISLLCFDRKRRKIFWSGANNPLWYVHHNELVEIKADKQSIGKTDYPKPFRTHEIEYNEDMTIYLFTDGFADQFGGPSGKKFKYKQFSELLVSIHNEMPAIQKQKLNTAFDDWKGSLEQVDDVCIIGIRI